ncbi:MAG: LysR family transcriptional regulator [Rubrivivax sp.]|jgi:DNA-binding transcriptional LysR family regulator|nr:LysR family transcriptional regulator [Rubrivivax sp.]
MSTRPLDPLTLRHFVAVCEEGSIARAAAREALVASALSKRIGALEAGLGVTLLHRRRRGVEPTPAGEALLARAREVLSALERVRGEVGAFAAGLQGSVRVLASPSVLAERLPEDIGRFLAAHPGLTVSLDERVSIDIVRSLHQGAADVGVLWDHVDLAGLHVVPYHRDHLCVAVTPAHRLARRPRVVFAELLEPGLDQPTIGVAPGGLMDQLLRRQAALLGRTMAYRVQVSSMDAACRMAAAGLGLAILPREAATPHAGAGRLALVPLDEPWAVRRFVIVRRPPPLQSVGAQRLGDFLQALAVGPRQRTPA